MVFEASTLKALFAAGTIAAAGWGAHVYLEDAYAHREEVLVAGAKADYVLDRQMSALLREIAYLEKKENKTADERDMLKWLREQLLEMRKVRMNK